MRRRGLRTVNKDRFVHNSCRYPWNCHLFYLSLVYERENNQYNLQFTIHVKCIHILEIACIIYFTYLWYMNEKKDALDSIDSQLEKIQALYSKLNEKKDTNESSNVENA